MEIDNKQHKIHEEYIIIVSSVVAVLITKLADPIFEIKTDLLFLENFKLVNLVFTLCVQLAILIIFVLILVKLIGWITRKGFFKF